MFLIDESESVRPQQTVDEGHEDVEEEDVQQESEAEANEEDCITEGTDTEHYESAVSDEAEPSTPSEARGRGRPKMIKTGKPGRPHPRQTSPQQIEPLPTIPNKQQIMPKAKN
ncbi:hypothetical protein ACLKA7_009949 [Drosophila subpalustris]